MSNFDPGLDPFPLFQTPSLVWEMVILRMGLLEIFTLSFCSENIYRAVQRLLHRNFDRYLLKVRLATEHRKEINRTCHHSFIIDDKAFWILKTPSNKNFKRECFTATIHGTPFKGYFMNESMITYWDDVETGMRLMIRYFSTMFGQDILHVHYAHSPKTVNSDLAIIDFLLNRQGRIEAADLLISKPKTVLEPLFERLKTVETLWFEVDRTLPVTVPIGLTWNHEELVLENAHWLTVPHMLLMNCKRLIIHNCLLQDFDVNAYLKNFVIGAVPLLEHLTIEAVRQDMMEVLEDLECQENPNRVLKTSPDDTRAMLITPMDIRQNGMTIATVFYTQETSFSISTYFLDVVKPTHNCIGPYDIGCSSYMI